LWRSTRLLITSLRPALLFLFYRKITGLLSFLRFRFYLGAILRIRSIFFTEVLTVVPAFFLRHFESHNPSESIKTGGIIA